jgi:hypothetical protein
MPSLELSAAIGEGSEASGWTWKSEGMDRGFEGRWLDQASSLN